MPSFYRVSEAMFCERVTAEGLEPRICSSVHWQICGAPFLVNFWPTKARFYVQGTNGSGGLGHYPPEKIMDVIIEAAWKAPRRAFKVKSPRPSRRWVRRTRERLWNSGQRQCCWCLKELNGPHDPDTTLEHKIPLARGGSAKQFCNLALSCQPCNKAHDDGNFLTYGLEQTLAESDR